MGVILGFYGVILRFYGVILSLYRGYVRTRSSYYSKVWVFAAGTGNGKWNTVRSQPFFTMFAPPQSDSHELWSKLLKGGLCGGLYRGLL